MCAASEGHWGVLQALIAAGAKTNLQCKVNALLLTRLFLFKSGARGI